MKPKKDADVKGTGCARETGPRGSRQGERARAKEAEVAPSNEAASTAEIVRPTAERLGQQEQAASLAVAEEEPAATARVLAEVAAVAAMDAAVQIAPDVPD